MKKIKSIIKSKRRELTLILVNVMVIILFFSGRSIGKEYESTNIQTSAKIAQPILVVEKNLAIEVNGKNEKEYYNFKIKNYKENGETSQVDLEYNIEILSETIESISFKLYKNEQKIELINNKTENIRIEKDNKKEDNFRLEIIYEKSKNTSEEDIVQKVQIKVHSEQIKI